MKRTIPVVVLLLAATFSGCTASEPREGPGLSSVAMDASGTGALDDYDFTSTVEWTATTQKSILDGDEKTVAEDGMKWVLVSVRVTNTGNSTYETAAKQYVVEAEGTVYEPVFFKKGSYLGGERVSPGDSVNRWLLFQVPEETSDATLSINQEYTGSIYSVEFEHNSELTFPVA